MSAACLVLSAALAAVAAAEPDTAALIAKLGSAEPAERAAAARALEALGREALPALWQARGADDRDLGARASALWDTIQRGLMTRPSLVRLDFTDWHVSSVLGSLMKQTGLTLEPDGGAGAHLIKNVPDPAPVTIWEALDRLGRAGHVRHDPGTRRDAIGNDAQASVIRLVDGDPPAYTAYSGPLRIHRLGTHRHRDLSFQTGDASLGPPSSATVTAEVQAFAEPGRFIDPDGPPRLEAIDAQGRTSPSRQGGMGQGPDPSEHQWLDPGRLSLLHWHVPLGLLDPPAEPLLKLRGALPVIMSARKPDPLVIPLADAAGKTFSQDGASVRVDSVTIRKARNTAVTLSLSEAERPHRPDRASSGPETDRVTELVRNRLEFLDDEGRPLSWILPNYRSPTSGSELRLELWVSFRTAPVRLLVYRLHRLATEVPFEVGEVPSP